MFSFRRRASTKSSPTENTLKPRPSLPELVNNDTPWPAGFIEVTPDDFKADGPSGRAAQSSINGASIPFHRPFRPGKEQPAGPISSIYMSSPPSAFESWRSSPHPTSHRGIPRKAPRIPTTFNLMCVGAKGTGKTTLLRLLLETADVSPSATGDQRAAMNGFLHSTGRPTQSIQAVCVEICESRYDRILFSVVDTPGLNMLEGHELTLERQTNALIRYIDGQYGDTMAEEAKVIRQGKGDQHIHAVIYMIDPTSVVTITSRREQSSLPMKTRSEAALSTRPPDLVPDTSSAEDSDSEESDPLTLSPADLKVIRRLSTHSNVIPVIAHADTLTDDRLAAVKRAIQRSLHDADLGFGVFEKSGKKKGGSTPAVPPLPRKQSNGSSASHPTEDDDEDDDEDEEEERPSRPVIKLRPSRAPSTRRSLSRNKSHRAASRNEDHEPTAPDATDKESVANVRFSAMIVAKPDLSTIMPFALIMPEHGKPRERAISPAERASSPNGDETGQMVPPVSVKTTAMLPYLAGPPDALKGVFTRKFRWGMVDVLNPDHCDFAALRTAVLSTHLKVLKTNTREVLYEKWRTEQLLTRRATRNVTDEDRRRMIEDLGL